jgi:serine/threonine protein phosphatase PrpC
MQMLRARYAIATRPFPGELENGDLALVLPETEAAQASAKSMLFGLIDGAGHGPVAAQVAALARSELTHRVPTTLEDALKAVHLVLAGTRGAVAGLARVDLVGGTLEYSGVGNIECRILHSDRNGSSLISYNGLLGHTFPGLRTFNHAITAGDMLILHSDGVSGHWQTSRYPGLSAEVPSMVASVLMRDWGRATDDATVLVVRFDGVGEERLAK